MRIRITYSPEGRGPQSWDFDPDTADNLELEAIEEAGGAAFDSFGEWMNLMGRGNTRAMRALLWVLLQRANPELDFNEVRFRWSELAVENLDEQPVGKDDSDDSDTGSPPLATDSAAS